MNKIEHMHHLFFLLLSVLLVPGSPLSAQKQIAITMDDPNTYETPLMGWEKRNDAILKTLNKHHIQAALFVCGMRVNDANGARLIKAWDDNQHLICNHTFSHLYYNGQENEVFFQDFQKGDSLIRSYKNYTKLFRFPFLKEGDSDEKRDTMRAVLEKNGYKNGYVTIDASDWYIDSKIEEVLKKDPKANLDVYKQFYIQHILDRINYYDSLAQILFKRDVKHTLLIHHSLLNALFLDDLLTALKANNCQLIDAREAYTDALGNLQPRVLPCGESIIWQCAKLDSTLAPTLRYPGEDSEYEEKPLQQMIEKTARLNSGKH